ncbi:polycystin-1-like [Saccoglossus kowalevskii]
MLILTFFVLQLFVHISVRAEYNLCSNATHGQASIIQRTDTSSSENQLILLDSSAFSCYGTVVGWRFWATQNTVFKVGVWRRMQDDYYSLVGENKIVVTTTGETIVQLLELQTIPFADGDVIGMRWFGPPFGYDLGTEARLVRYVAITTDDYLADWEYGTIKHVINTATRAYGIEALVENQLVCPVQEYGQEVRNRGNVDGASFAMVICGLPIPCYGRVTGWRFFSAADNAFKVGIYRPVSGNVDQFRLVGETLISADNPITEETTVLVDELNQFDFLPGDVIGFRFESSALSYEIGSVDSTLTKWAIHNSYEYSNTNVGDTLTFNDGSENRAYSVQVLFTQYDYYGCHNDEPNNREFARSAAKYDHQKITPGICIELCGERGFYYAGVQQGELCFCSNTYGTHRNADPTYCDHPCSGDRETTCGGELYNDVFKTAELLSGFEIIAYDGLISTYDNTSIQVNETRGEDISYNLDLSDGYSIGPTSEDTVYHVFKKPGKAAIEATGIDKWSTVEVDSVAIEVETPIGNITFVCPLSIEVNTAFLCDIKIDQGTNMSANVNFSDGRIIDMEVSDAEVVWYGDLDEPDITLNNQPANTIFLLVNQLIKEDGKLVGWEINAIATGNVYLQVYRPNCPTNLQFCYRTHSCIPVGTTCKNLTDFWSKSCDSVGHFSFSKRKCVKSSDNSLVNDKIFSNQPVDYKGISVFEYNIESTGKQYIALAQINQIAVQQGDVIAWYNSNEGQIGYVSADPSKDGPEFLLSSSSQDLRNAIGYTAVASSSVPHAYKHSLRAHVIRPATIRLLHNYTDENTQRQDITINITNDISSRIKIHEMKIQTNINNLEFVNPQTGITGKDVNLEILEHSGSEVIYNWYFGNGDFNETNYKSFNYTWESAGVYTVTLYAYNEISDAYFVSWITIQDDINELSWNDSSLLSLHPEYPITPKALGDETILSWCVSQGTNITYEVNLDDFVLILLPFDEDPLITPLGITALHHGLSGSVRYTYPSIGYYNISVNASNLVSSKIIYGMAIVQLPITNFRLSDPGPIAHGEEEPIFLFVDTGTNMTFNGTFNQVSIGKEDFFFNEAMHEGYAMITPDKYTIRGILPFSVTAVNLVSGPFVYNLDIHVEYPVRDLRIWTDDPDVEPNTVVTVTFDMLCGTGLTLTLDYDDNNVVYTADQMFRSNNDSMSQLKLWPFAKEYNVTITAENVLGIWQASTIEYVQNPVRDIVISTNTPGIIPWNSNGTITYTWTFNGLNVPSSVSAHYFIAIGIEFDFELPFDTTGLTTISHDVSLAKYGTYYTQITLANRINSMMFESTIDMEEPVENVTFQINHDQPYLEVGETIEATVMFSWGSRVSFYWDFGDGNAFGVAEGGLTTHSNAYLQPGQYNLQVTTSNILGHVTAILEIIVQYPVKGFVFRGRRLNKIENNNIDIPYNLYISKNIPLEEFPTEAKITIDFGVPGPIQWMDLTMANALTSMDTNAERHVWNFNGISYSTPGHVVVVCNIWNLVSNITYTYDIYIYQSITNLDKEVKYNEYIIRKQGGPGDENLDENAYIYNSEVYLPFEEAVVFVLTYDTGTGLTFTWEFDDEFSMCIVTPPPPTGMTTQITTTDIPTTEARTREQTTTNTLDSDNATYTSTNMWSSLDGTYTSMMPTQGTTPLGTTPEMSPCNTLMVTTEPRAIWWFSSPGDYIVTVNVSNPVHWDTEIILVHIEASVQDLKLSDHGPMPVNTTIFFKLDTGNVGTDACYFVDFGDITSKDNYYAFWGEEYMCSFFWPEHFQNYSDILRFYNTSSYDLLSMKEAGNDPIINLHNYFMNINEYTVTVTGQNHVSQEIVSIITTVTKGPCYYPIVVLQEKNLCNENFVTCDETTGYRQYMASTEVKVYSEVTLNCTTTNRAYFTWRAFRQLGDGDEEEADLGDTETSGLSIGTLTIKKLTLGYGLYRMELNVSMYGEIGVETVESAYIYIVATPLVASISGGSEIRVRWSALIEIDGLSDTYDPDVEQDNKLGMEFIWMCRRMTYTIDDDTTIENVETFQEWDEYYQTQLSPAVTNAEFVGEIGDIGGCFGRDVGDEVLFSEPGGKINFTSGHIEINTEKMYYNMLFEIKMIVIKGDRIATASQVLDVTEGNPPRMSIRCKLNCMNKVSTTSRFSLESINQDFIRGVFLYYKWEVQLYQSSRYIPISSSEWRDSSGTGSDGQNFSLEKGFLIDVSFYRIKVIASRNPDFSNYGSASRDITTNEVPIVGTCYPIPTNGTALNTTFNFYCSGFDDPHKPLLYRFATTSSNGSYVWMYSGENPSMDQPATLPAGEEEDDYFVTIIVRVSDSYGSYSDFTSMKVQVFPQEMDTRDMKSLIKELTTGTNSPMDLMIGSGKAGAANNIAAACAKTLNKFSTKSKVANNGTFTVTPTVGPFIGTTSTTKYTTASTLTVEDEEDMEENTEIRTELVKGAVSGAVTSMGELKQRSSTMELVSYDPYELSQEAQDTMVDSLQVWTSFLEDQANGGEVNANLLEDGGSGLLVIASNALQSSVVTVQRATTKAEELRAELEILATTEAPDPDALVAKRRRRREINNAIEEAEVANEQSRQRSEKVMGITDTVVSIVKNNLVAGQDDVQVTGNGISVQVGITFPDKLENKKIEQGDGITVELPTVYDMFGDENITYIAQEMVVYQDNFITWSNSSESVQGSLVAFTMYNETGEFADLSELQEPIKVMVPNYGDLDAVEVFQNVTTPLYRPMSVHKITVEDNTALVIDVRPLTVNGTNTDNVTMYMFFGVGYYPDDRPGGHDFNCSVPRQPQFVVGDNDTLDISNLWELQEPYLWSCFFSNSFLESFMNVSNDIYVGVKHTGGWNQTAADDYLAGTEYTNFWPLHYELRDFTLQCSWYNNETLTWETSGITVGERSTINNIECLAQHLTLFGGGFKLPMNSIDFSDSAFTKLDENPVVFAFMVSCIGAYLAVIVWARKADKRDKLKAGATPLKDNDPRDHYNYEITIFTGVRNNSDTTAKVSMILTGDLGETEPRLIDDEKRKVFQRGGVDTFIMAVPTSLGTLFHVRVWHDNAGKTPSWFLSRISIKDLQTDRMYFFMLDRWLAVEEEDGQIERVIPVAGKSELTSFGHLFYSKTRRNMSDGHLWFSIFIRPARSRFTRVQRATCCVSLLFCTMMANIFFYNVDMGAGAVGNSYTLGPISFSLAELTIGVISSLMVFPVTLIVVQIFRNVKEHPKVSCCCCKKKKKHPAIAYQQRFERTTTDRAVSELKNELTLLDADDFSGGFLKVNLEEGRTLSASSARPVSRISMVSNSSVAVDFTSADRDGYLRKPVAGFKKTRKKKKKFELPWWFIYVGWFFAGASLAVAFMMTIEVAGQFGKEKSEEWLKSMVFSVLQDVLITQPIKVLFMAMFYALVIKTPDKEDEEISPHLNTDEEWTHDRMTEEELHDPERVAKMQEEKIARLSNIKQPDTDELEEARVVRFKEIKMHAIIKEIIFYMSFLYLLMIICYGNRDPAGYLLNKSLVDGFVGAGYNGLMRFDMVSNRDYFWNYTENVFVPTLFSGPWYNGQEDKYGAQTKAIADRSTSLIGVVRLRQLRVDKENCTLHEVMEDVIKNCKKSYSSSNELNVDTIEGWKLYTNESDEPDYTDSYNSVWKYRSWHEIDSYPYYAKHNLYNGGGYVATLGNDYDDAMDMVSYLKSSNWIDQYSRAVFFEFVVFNPPSNMFSVSYLIVEFLPTGGAFPYVKFHTLPLDRYYGTWMYFVLAAEVTFVLVILYFLYREGKGLHKQKKKYFKSFWNWMEVVTLSLAITAIVMYFYRLSISWRVIAKYKQNKKGFTNFQYLAYWDELFGYMMSLVLFISTLKFLKLLRFNRRMLLLNQTIKAFWYDVLMFLVIFGIIFFAFAHFAFLIFGITLRDFSTVVLTIESLFSTLLGKFEFEDMVMASRYLGPIFFFFYVMLVMFVLLNMFLSIINEGFSQVKARNDSMENELEIVDFMVDRFKKWTGFAEKRVPRTAKAYTYIEGNEPVQVKCDEMREKLSNMVDRLNELVRDEKKDNKHIFGDINDETPRNIYTS